MKQLYQSAPLEQAYSLYIGQQVFGVLPASNQIQISGRDAVSFLTQSNVDRGILRSLWTAADPQNIGTLSQLHQFQLLLRLVAMAQAGLLNSSMTVDTMKAMVQQYSAQQLALPSFSSVMVPQQDQLMNAYGNYVISNVQPVAASTTLSQQGGDGFWSLSQNSSPSLVGKNYSSATGQQTTAGFGQASGSFGDGFQQAGTSSGMSMGTSSFGQASNLSTGPTFGAPSAAPLASPTQQFGGEVPEGFNTSTQLPTVSVSDAFGDMGDVPSDAPLPSLENINGSIDGGGSMDQSEMSGSLQPSGSKDSGVAVSIQNADSFQSAQASSVQSNTFQPQDDNFVDAAMNQGAAVNQQPQHSDDFGTFEAASSTNMHQAPAAADLFAADGQNAAAPSLDQTAQFTPQPKLGDDFGGFEDAAPIPAPISEESYSQMAQQQTHNDDFGGSEAVAPAPIDQGTGDSDPFGPSQDAPLPTLDQTTQPAPQQAEEDDFGDFEDATPARQGAGYGDPFGPIAGSQDAPLPSLGQRSQVAPEQTQSDDFGGFEAAPTVTDGTNVESDPFGPLAGSQDAPLPSLDQVSQPVPQQVEEDNFGGFEDAAPAPVDQGVRDSDPFGPLASSLDAPLPSLEQASQPTTESDDFKGFEDATPAPVGAEDSDPFGPLAGSQDAPLSSLEQISQPATQQQEDDFGGFEAAAPVQANQDLESDPFGPLAGSQDARLPSLDQALASQQNDDFGGFDTAALVNTDAEVVNVESDPFGTMVGSEDAPLPSLDQTNQVGSQSEQGDDFGGFETVSPGIMGATPDDSDPFGPMVGNQEAPLPSLGQSPQGDQGDDFGGFETGAPATTGITPDDSDPFGSIAGSQDAPLPSLAQTSQPVSQDLEDDFGDFENAGPVTNGDDSDPFGPIVGSHDAPLPSLGQAAQTEFKENQGDDFGGFEAAPSVSAGTTPDGSDPFGPIAGSQDAPLPSLGDSFHPTSQGMQDDFGGFETADNAIAAAESDLFGPLEGSQNAPLQQNADFGGFENAAPAVLDATSTEPDLFGPLEGGQEPSQPLQTGQTQGQPNLFGGENVEAGAQLKQTDDFGDFSGAEEATAGFDAFGSNQTSTPTVSADDDFRDFGGAQEGAVDFGAFESTAAPTPAPSSGDGFGDFGGVQDSTDFGAFESTTTPAPAASRKDDFGHFGGAEEATKDASATEANITSDDDFGNFGEAPSEAAIPSENEEDDLFGDNAPKTSFPSDDDWGDFAANPPKTDTQVDPSNVTANPNVDDFGDFGSSNAPVQDDDWGAFDSSAQAPSPAPSNEDAGDFGDFSEPKAAAPQSNDDELGAFDSNTGTDAGKAPAPEAQPPAQDDEWGHFDSNTGAEKATTAAPPVPAQNDDRGTFGTATAASRGPRFDSFASSTNYTSASGSVDGSLSSEDDDFGDFEGDAVQIKIYKKRLQEKIRAYASQLPESLLRKSGLSGEHIDLGECFSVNIGLDGTADPARKAIVDRCLRVLSKLTKRKHLKLPSYWEQMFLVVKEELTIGKQLLAEASNVSKAELQKVQKPLLIMISGFAEYLRVVRSIVGTIGDLLLLDDSALLTIDTYASTWCSLDILKIPVEIEQLWKEVEKAAINLSIRSLQPKDATLSLTAIRSKATQMCVLEELCELTLVPLSKQDRGTTCGIVSWQGKDFMACSANILANRCPFYVVVE